MKTVKKTQNVPISDECFVIGRMDYHMEIYVDSDGEDVGLARCSFCGGLMSYDYDKDGVPSYYQHRCKCHECGKETGEEGQYDLYKYDGHVFCGTGNCLADYQERKALNDFERGLAQCYRMEEE